MTGLGVDRGGYGELQIKIARRSTNLAQAQDGAASRASATSLFASIARAFGHGSARRQGFPRFHIPQ